MSASEDWNLFNHLAQLIEGWKQGCTPEQWSDFDEKVLQDFRAWRLRRAERATNERQQALKVLGSTVQPDGSLCEQQQYVSWTPGDKDVTLDADFGAEELEAIAWWMRNAVSEPDAH